MASGYPFGNFKLSFKQHFSWADVLINNWAFVKLFIISHSVLKTKNIITINTLKPSFLSLFNRFVR
jgi:hypothetical protein